MVIFAPLLLIKKSNLGIENQLYCPYYIFTYAAAAADKMRTVVITAADIKWFNNHNCATIVSDYMSTLFHVLYEGVYFIYILNYYQVLVLFYHIHIQDPDKNISIFKVSQLLQLMLHCRCCQWHTEVVSLNFIWVYIFDLFTVNFLVRMVLLQFPWAPG